MKVMTLIQVSIEMLTTLPNEVTFQRSDKQINHATLMLRFFTFSRVINKCFVFLLFLANFRILLCFWGTTVLSKRPRFFKDQSQY